MRLSFIIGVVTVITSAFLIIFTLNTFVAINITCSTQESVLTCEFVNLGIPLIIGFSFIVGFIIIDIVTVYIIIKGWSYITGLKIRYDEIEKLKEAAEKNYYKKKIDEQNRLRSNTKERDEVKEDHC